MVRGQPCVGRLLALSPVGALQVGHQGLPGGESVGPRRRRFVPWGVGPSVGAEGEQQSLSKKHGTIPWHTSPLWGSRCRLSGVGQLCSVDYLLQVIPGELPPGWPPWCRATPHGVFSTWVFSVCPWLCPHLPAAGGPAQSWL